MLSYIRIFGIFLPVSSFVDRKASRAAHNPLDGYQP